MRFRPLFASPLLRSFGAVALYAAVASVASVLALGAVGCNRVRVDDVRGPDGADWKRLQCKHMDEKCYLTASRMCPNGYYFARAAGAGPAVGPAVANARDDDDDDDATPRASSAPRPRAGVNTKTLPPQEKWGRGMYSSKRGTILVQCAETSASR